MKSFVNLLQTTVQPVVLLSSVRVKSGGCFTNVSRALQNIAYILWFFRLYHYSVLFYISTDVPFYAFMYPVFYLYSAREHCGLALYKLINYHYYSLEIYILSKSYSYENFKLKLCTCDQSHALGTCTTFQLEILSINVISGIVHFRDIILESSRNVSETTPWFQNAARRGSYAIGEILCLRKGFSFTREWRCRQ